MKSVIASCGRSCTGLFAYPTCKKMRRTCPLEDYFEIAAQRLLHQVQAERLQIESNSSLGCQAICEDMVQSGHDKEHIKLNALSYIRECRASDIDLITKGKRIQMPEAQEDIMDEIVYLNTLAAWRECGNKSEACRTTGMNYDTFKTKLRRSKSDS